MAKKNGGNNKRPLKNANLIGAGEKKSIDELKQAPNQNAKKTNETFVQREQRIQKDNPPKPKEDFFKNMVKRDSQKELQKSKDKEPDKDK